MLGLGRLGICAAARCRLAAPAARRARPQRRWQSTKQQAPEQAAKREGSGGPAVAEAEAAAEAAPPSMDSVLSMENLMKMAVGVPLLAPSLFFIGQGMEEKAFLGEVEAWTQQAEYKHSDAEHLAAKDCMRYVMAGQIGGLAVGGTVGWALAGLRAIPIALCAMLGGQVGAVYPTQLMTGNLLTLPDSKLAAEGRSILAKGKQDHHRSLRERHADALRKAEMSARRHRGAFRNE